MKHLKKNPIFLLLILLPFLIFTLYWYGERWLRTLILYLSTATWARQTMSNWGIAWQVASRFIAGTDIDAAMAATRTLNAKGMCVTLDYLGESVTNAEEAARARDQILMLLERIHHTGAEANVSIKLSQLGLKLDEKLAYENMRCLAERARQFRNKIRMDMEDSSLVDTTLRIYHTLYEQDGLTNIGVVIQAYLYRSEADIKQLVSEGAWVRLCKGAYAEPPEVAFPLKADTDANYIKLMQLLLSNTARQNGVYAGIATHDPDMIEATLAYATAHQIPQQAFEFQMLYGIRRELQEKLVADGYKMRVYVPYGTAWYPYFMRRLAERPANLWFFIRNFFRN